MSPTSPPIISEKRVIAHVNAYVKAKEQDVDWGGGLLDTRLRLISEHYVAETCLHWPMMRISWWNMGQPKLIDTHKWLVSQRLLKVDRELNLKKVSPTTRVEDANHLASTDRPPKSDSVPVTSNASAKLSPESSDVDSIDFSRNENLINTTAIPVVTRDDKIDSPPISSSIGQSCGPISSQGPRLVHRRKMRAQVHLHRNLKKFASSAFRLNHSGGNCRGDPMEPLMEPLKFPGAIPPRGKNHYLGRYVADLERQWKY